MGRELGGGARGRESGLFFDGIQGIDRLGKNPTNPVNPVQVPAAPGLSLAKHPPRRWLPHMPSPSPSRRLLQAGLALLLGGALPAGGTAETNAGEILSPTELAALNRENAMWRLVRPDEEVPANLARLAKAGFTVRETAGVQLKLAAWWDIPVDRNFGWLHEEAVRQIQEIDRHFVVRMRAARLFEGTGILRGGETVSSGDLPRLWRSAILKVLNYDELSEFRLMNSAAARELTQLVKDLPVTDDELRTLFEWQREFAGTQRLAGPTGASQPAWQREEQLDQWRRIRELLGDTRFTVYLDRATPAFAKMHLALDNTGAISPTVALDLWWLRQREGWTRDQEHGGKKRDELTAQLKVRVVALLGAAQTDSYAAGPDGRWLTIRARPPQPASAPVSVKP